MTVKECIDQVDIEKPNQFRSEDKLRWLTYIERKIILDVLKNHEGYNKQYDTFDGYSLNDLESHLIAEPPYDQLYIAFIKMKIDEENGETTRYNNSAIMFNEYYDDYRKAYHRSHMPLQKNYYDTIGFHGRRR